MRFCVFHYGHKHKAMISIHHGDYLVNHLKNNNKSLCITNVQFICFFCLSACISVWYQSIMFCFRLLGQNNRTASHPSRHVRPTIQVSLFWLVFHRLTPDIWELWNLVPLNLESKLLNFNSKIYAVVMQKCFSKKNKFC